MEIGFHVSQAGLGLDPAATIKHPVFMRCWGPNLGLPDGKQALYLLNYISGPCLVILIAPVSKSSPMLVRNTNNLIVSPSWTSVELCFVLVLVHYREWVNTCL